MWVKLVAGWGPIVLEIHIFVQKCDAGSNLVRVIRKKVTVEISHEAYAAWLFSFVHRLSEPANV